MMRTTVICPSLLMLLSAAAGYSEVPPDGPFVDGFASDPSESSQSYSIRCQNNTLQLESRIETGANLKRTKTFKLMLDGRELNDERLEMVRHAFFSDPVLLAVELGCPAPNGFSVFMRYRWRAASGRLDLAPYHWCTAVRLLVVPRDGNRIYVERTANFPSLPVDLGEGRPKITTCF